MIEFRLAGWLRHREKLTHQALRRACRAGGVMAARIAKGRAGGSADDDQSTATRSLG